MVVSEIAVWAVAIVVNIFSLMFAEDYYQTTLVTQLLYKILTIPYPYWGVVVLSGAGTFLSIRFGDEIMDVLHHRERHFFHANHFKHELILFLFFLCVLFGYYELISSLGIETDRLSSA